MITLKKRENIFEILINTNHLLRKENFTAVKNIQQNQERSLRKRFSMFKTLVNVKGIAFNVSMLYDNKKFLIVITNLKIGHKNHCFCKIL